MPAKGDKEIEEFKSRIKNIHDKLKSKAGVEEAK